MNFKDLLSKEWFRLAGMLFIGITIGAVFYPTKHIEERITSQYEKIIIGLKTEHTKEMSDLNETYTKALGEARELHIESEKKVAKLTEENRTLQSKVKTAKYKIVRPDGTIEEQEFTDSEVNETSHVVTQIQEEFKTKIDQIETKWSTIHTQRVQVLKKEFDSKETQYQQTIASLKSERIEDTNQKRFGIEAGYLSDKNYYGHATMDLWGPVFLGVHGELGSNSDNKLGAGLGLRF